MAYEIGLSSAGKVMDEQLFAAYRDAGLSCMEISRDLYGFEKVDFADVKQLADRYGIRLWSLHLPFDPFHILDPSSCRRREAQGNGKAFYGAYLQRRGNRCRQICRSREHRTDH